MRNPSESTAANNSNGSAQITYKRLSYSRLLSADLSDELHTYSVSVIGKNHDKEIEIISMHDEHHPLAAVGRAIVQFLKRYPLGGIDDVRVSERVPKIKTKSNR